MKKFSIIVFLLVAACTRSVDDPVTAPFPNTILGKWDLTAKQGPGYGPPGVWTTSAPGMFITIDNAGHIGGNVFTDVTSYQIIDSATVKFIAPSQPAGFYLFNYQLDTVARVFYLYVRPVNGGYCIEGCGTYKFTR